MEFFTFKHLAYGGKMQSNYNHMFKFAQTSWIDSIISRFFFSPQANISLGMETSNNLV